MSVQTNWKNGYLVSLKNWLIKEISSLCNAQKNLLTV